MKVLPTALDGVLLIEPPVYQDERGFFCESFNLSRWQAATGLDLTFVQDNHSRSRQGVLRGLHYQAGQHSQGKLVRVLHGEVFTVAVDLRRHSSSFAQHLGIQLRHHQQLWIPPGFAHGFLVLSESADCLYKTTTYYAPEAERSIRWDDTDLNIAWPLEQPPLVSARDQQALPFSAAELFD